MYVQRHGERRHAFVATQASAAIELIHSHYKGFQRAQRERKSLNNMQMTLSAWLSADQCMRAHILDVMRDAINMQL